LKLKGINVETVNKTRIANRSTKKCTSWPISFILQTEAYTSTQRKHITTKAIVVSVAKRNWTKTYYCSWSSTFFRCAHTSLSDYRLRSFKLQLQLVW